MVLIYDAETARGKQASARRAGLSVGTRSVSRESQTTNALRGSELAPRFRKALQAEIYSQRAESSEISRMKRYMGKRPHYRMSTHWLA